MQRATQTLPRPLNDTTDIVVVFLLTNLHRYHTQCNAYSIYLEQTFVSRVDVKLIFKNDRRNKEVYTKCRSKKIPEVGSAPYNRKTELKMVLLLKIVSYF